MSRSAMYSMIEPEAKRRQLLPASDIIDLVSSDDDEVIDLVDAEKEDAEEQEVEDEEAEEQEVEDEEAAEKREAAEEEQFNREMAEINASIAKYTLPDSEYYFMDIDYKSIENDSTLSKVQNIDGKSNQDLINVENLHITSDAENLIVQNCRDLKILNIAVKNATLTYLKIDNCLNLKRMRVEDGMAVKTLEVSKCKNLLDIYGSWVGLENLDLTGNTLLKFDVDSAVNLVSLKVNACPKFSYAAMNMGKLKSVEFRNMTLLRELYPRIIPVGVEYSDRLMCVSTWRNLEKFVLYSCDNARFVIAMGNKLNTVKVEKCPFEAVVGMSVRPRFYFKNVPSLTNLSISDSDALIGIDFLYRNLKKLNIQNCNSLKFINLQHRGLSSPRLKEVVLKEVVLKNCPNLIMVRLMCEYDSASKNGKIIQKLTIENCDRLTPIINNNTKSRFLKDGNELLPQDYEIGFKLTDDENGS